MGKIRLAGIVNDSIVDGPGLRLAVFTQGCAHNCPSCHNPETHDFNGGYEEDIDNIVKMALNNPLLSGVTLTGGDPFYQVDACLELAYKLSGHGLSLIVYTGFTWEELDALRYNNPAVNRFLHEMDFLIDGPFIREERDLSLRFRGSTNQRIIDVQKTLMQHELVTANW